MLRFVPALLVALLLAGCLGSAETGKNGDGRTLAQRHGVQLHLEPGWVAAERSLTPDLLNPKEVLTVGTGPLKPGSCATVPSRAVRAMSQGDALITVQEREGGRPQDFPARPEPFRVRPAIGTFECAPKSKEVQSFAFSDAGRRFYVLVVVDGGARTEEAEAVLDSFRALPDTN